MALPMSNVVHTTLAQLWRLDMIETLLWIADNQSESFGDIYVRYPKY